MNLSDQFYCRAERNEMTIDNCETRFCNANALGEKRSRCWKCSQGRSIRRRLAFEGRRIDVAALLVALMDQKHEGERVQAEEYGDSSREPQRATQRATQRARNGTFAKRPQAGDTPIRD